MKERLQKFIASSGISSRRKAETFIVAGEVKVNGKTIRKLGTTVDPAVDQVTVQGRTIKPATQFRYIILNKPSGIVCTRATHKGEKTVYDLVPQSRDLVIAGRLDKDSEGLVLLTNDGELTNKLTHPRYGHAKEYLVTTVRPIAPTGLDQLRRGVQLQEGKARVDAMTEITPAHYRVILHQGWKRQIRRMLRQVGADVKRLTRVRMQQVALGNLKPGEYRTVELQDILG